MGVIFGVVAGIYAFGVETEAQCRPTDAPGNVYSLCAEGDKTACDNLKSFENINIANRF